MKKQDRKLNRKHSILGIKFFGIALGSLACAVLITSRAGQGAKEPESSDSHAAKAHASNKPYTNHDWWPNRLDLRVLKENTPTSDPIDEGFDYAKEFSTLDLKAVKGDITNLLTNSKDWWPSVDTQVTLSFESDSVPGSIGGNLIVRLTNAVAANPRLAVDYVSLTKSREGSPCVGSRVYLSGTLENLTLNASRQTRKI